MATKRAWTFSSFEDLEAKYADGLFDCNDIAEITDPMILDWCERLSDWAPKVALCFNLSTSNVTLDRMSQCEMAEVRRLVCYHPNVSMETLERLQYDGDRDIRETASEYLDRKMKASRPRTRSRYSRA